MFLLLPKKNLFKKKLSLISLAFIVILGALLRFYNPRWDLEHYLHPDERLYINASNIKLPKTIAEFFSPQSPLNPHMFYYGSLPLYFYVFLDNIITRNFGQVVNLLPLSRLVSASLSTASIIILFALCQQIFSIKTAIIATAFFSFSVGSIQYAHYNTTESALTFLALLLTYLSFLFLRQFNRKKKNKIKNNYLKIIILAITMALTLGGAVATKITGLSLGIVPLTAFFLAFISLVKRKKEKIILILGRFFLLGLIFFIVAGITGFLGAPYNIIDYPSFYKEQEYMQGVILGKYKPPFTIIYEATPPYFYQLTKILPWAFSPLSLLLSISGLFLVIYKMIKKKNFSFLLILIWPLVYFAVIGRWYAKFTRYIIPFLPFLSIYAAYTFECLSECLSRKKISLLFTNLFLISAITFQVIYSIGFVKQIYAQKHTRISASDWVYQNLEKGAFIATEHWDDGLPLPLPNHPREKFNYLELTVYNPDNEEKISDLVNKLGWADYLIFSSRRVFYSIQRNQKLYPFTSRFYDLLFAGQLGFELVHKEEHYPCFLGITLNDNSADESFQSYDHPPVYIFKNTKHFSPEVIKETVKKT